MEMHLLNEVQILIRINYYNGSDAMRTHAEKRHNDWKKAIRKRKIIRQYGFDYYDNLHQYSKNKIHCSCPLCACKTRGKTVKKTGGPGENWSIKDEKRIEEMQDQIFDNE